MEAGGKELSHKGSRREREWGSKPGSGGAASAENEAVDRRERLRRLALETIDVAKDPYFMRNHLGRYSLSLDVLLLYLSSVSWSLLVGRRVSSNDRFEEQRSCFKSLCRRVCEQMSA